ncbi:MAG TPA: SIS domain-containing protein [Candidatus Didemnitutus sp.]|nr:SIS domain-containing protein [Candidatus Didemnitutus sp.]
MSFETSQQETIRTLQALGTLKLQIDQAGQMLVRTLKAGKKIIACGNGGSAAEAQHLTTELLGRFFKNRRSLPAVALTSDGTLVTCIGNDYGYDQVFSRQIEGLAQPGDVVVVLTSSGNSTNILLALDAAKKLGLETIALLGRGGGKAKGKATCEIIVPGESGAAAQECHLFLIHHFCEAIDAEFN